MGGDRCISIQSFGSLQHFRPDKTPTAAMGDEVKTCFDCPVQKSCPYSVEKIYMGPAKRGHIQWPVSVVCDLEDLAKKDKDPLKGLKVHMLLEYPFKRNSNYSDECSLLWQWQKPD